MTTPGICPFGTADGADIHEVTLASAAGAEARIITWGAVLRDLVIPTPMGERRVVLGYEHLEHYLSQTGNFGAIVGRYGNRIAGARFALDGRIVTLEANEGPNQLHGGSRGFGRRPWSIVARDRASVTLALVSEDGDMGFPGRLVATCTYRLLEPATLRLELRATADQATPVNLTTHIYYNLDGSPSIADHRLTIQASHVTPTGPDLIPTGAVAPVAETPYDFRVERPVGGTPDYDLNYVLDREPGPALSHAASVRSEKSGIGLELWTTEPGVQFYAGHKIAATVPGLGGASYGRNGGLCLEPQRWPDGPNRSYFPPCILRPGQVSEQTSEIRFSVTR